MRQIKTIEIEINADGTITAKTGDMSGINHANVEQFLTRVETLLEADVEKTSLKASHHHHHSHSTKEKQHIKQ